MSHASATGRIVAGDAAAPSGEVDALLDTPLTFEVECLTSRTARRGNRHPVTLHGDGTLETPHDLAAERVAAAFGGYCSCLELADGAPAIVADAVGLLTRRTRPALRRREDGRWSLRRSADCACPTAFRSAEDAAAHARGLRHLAARHGVREPVARQILDGIERVLAGCPEDEQLATRVRESRGPERLWAAGVHPDDARTWSHVADVVAEPLPMAYYLGFAYGPADGAFVHGALPGRPDGDTAAWLAWLPAGRGRGEDYRVLLAAGVPRHDVLTLLAGGVGEERLGGLAAEAGLPVRTVARLLAAWAAAECWPEAAHLRLLAAHGLTAHRPSPALLDRLAAEAARLAAPGPPPSRTELAVMTALVGGRAGVVEALGRGVTSAPALVEWMEER